MKSTDELSKLVSVHSLALNSTIKIPGTSTKRLMEPKKIETQADQKEEDINITFNNNNFAVAGNSKNAGLGMGRRWREETLKEELRGMNDEHFRKISVQAMNFD